jgi:DNA-binding transcriptional regulator YiaG
MAPGITDDRGGRFVKRGPQPNKTKQREAARLRRQGMPWRDIGQRLGGITTQAAQQLAQDSGDDYEHRHKFRCRACRTVIVSSVHAFTSNSQTAWCKACLAKRPTAPIGERIKTFRISADLTTAELSRRTGVSWDIIRNFERGKTQPMWHHLEKLLRFFGSELLPTFQGEWNLKSKGGR